MKHRRHSGQWTLVALGVLIVFGSVRAASAQAGKAASHEHTTRMDPDHHLLRDLADHNEAMVHFPHSAMEMKHAHAGGTDAAGATDGVEDATMLRRSDVQLLPRKVRAQYVKETAAIGSATGG